MTTINLRVPTCPHGNKNNISPELLRALSRLEKAIGHELPYNSGYRCPQCNAAAGGAKNSAHLRGLAVDISCVTSPDRFRILLIALSLGFCRVGIGTSFIHLDIDTSLAQAVVWLY
jgi:uncharacterized protein YcbK (DUF882 family)